MNAKIWAMEMALYNKWQNETLFGLLDAMSDADRTRDRGMFFASIHNTLDHILLVDTRLWHFVVTGSPPDNPFDPSKSLWAEYQNLRDGRTAFDSELIDHFRSMAEDWLDQVIVFDRPKLNIRRAAPRMFFCMQMFNHATHHRAQVTAELHKAGIDYGITDLPFNPLSQF